MGFLRGSNGNEVVKEMRCHVFDGDLKMEIFVGY